MSRNSDKAVVAGAGYMADLYVKLTAAVIAAGGTPDDVYRLVKKDGADTLSAIAPLIARHPASVQTVAKAMAALDRKNGGKYIVYRGSEFQKWVESPAIAGHRRPGGAGNSSDSRGHVVRGLGSQPRLDRQHVGY